MLTYEYNKVQSGLGSNGANDLNAFIGELKAKKGPFVYIGKDSPEGQKFITWLTLYDPSSFEYLMKLALLKGAAAALTVSEGVAQIPGWVSGHTIQFQKSLYDLYLSATARVQGLLKWQGRISSTALVQEEWQSFLGWWKTYDLPGVTALISMYVVEEEDLAKPPPMDFPKKLYDFWKITKGTQSPPDKLLGFGTQSWFDWALDNWLWLFGGAVGGVVAGNWYMKRRADRSVEELAENPKSKLSKRAWEMAKRETRQTKKKKPSYWLPDGPRWDNNPRTREGWGTEVKTKDGVFRLHPIIHETHYKHLRAAGMRSANKFRVSEGGNSLGELHKSHGKRKWKAISYYGVEKFGNSRAALLRWLKDEAPVQAMEQQLEEMSIPMPTMTTNTSRKVQ